MRRSVKIADLTSEHLRALGETEMDWVLNDFCFVALRGEKPIAAGGIVKQSDVTGYCWFVPSDEIHPREWGPITRAVKKATELYLEESVRVYMNVDADNPKALRWATRLGFKQTGRQVICEKYAS